MQAMKAHCRSDYMAHCGGVPPGGKAALQCLQHHVRSLHAACRRAVSATMHPAKAAHKRERAKMKTETAMPAPPPAASRPSAAAVEAVKANCRSDYMAHCRAVPPGGREAMQCLQRNVGSLSGACRRAVSATMGPARSAHGRMNGAPLAVAPPPAEPHTQTLFAPGAAIIAKACARTLMLHCRHELGEGRAVACLKAWRDSGHFVGFRCNAALKLQSKL